MTFPTFRLDGQIAVVTGGGQGLGHSIALGLANAGATVVVGELLPELLEPVERELEALGRPGLAVKMDVSDPQDVQRVFDRVVERYGRVDALVNNAGVRVHKRVMDHTLEDWEHVFRVNCTGPLICCQAAARIMRENGGGSILNMASQLATVVSPMRVAYCSSKAALVQMTRVMAVDWAEYGIRVNALGPGPTKTPFNAAAASSGSMSIAVDMVPLGRMAEADEMIGAALFLLSDAGSFVTGSFLVADGGQSVYWR